MTQGLQAPCGEPGFEQDPMAALVLHINREVIHHGAEISLLRDLFSGPTMPAVDLYCPALP